MRAVVYHPKEQIAAADRHQLHNFHQPHSNRPAAGLDVVRRAKQGATCQMKDLMFQNLASRNYRVLQT
jgi:hypothetical protein